MKLYDKTLTTNFRTISRGMMSAAKVKQIIQLLGVRHSTASIAPPNVTKANCKIKISNIIAVKVLLRHKCSKGFKFVVVALKPLKVIDIMKVAKRAVRR